MEKIVYTVLIFLSFFIFGIYVWFTVNYNHIHGGYAFGILAFSIIVFVTGVMNFYDVCKRNKRQYKSN